MTLWRQTVFNIWQLSVQLFFKHVERGQEQRYTNTRLQTLIAGTWGREVAQGKESGKAQCLCIKARGWVGGGGKSDSLLSPT